MGETLRTTEISLPNPPELVPLGDQGIIAYLPDESAALQFAQALRNSSFPWLIDVVPAYRSVGVFFDPEQLRMRDALAALSQLRPANMASTAVRRLHRIPCCYEMQHDWRRVSERTGHSIEELIRLHTGVEYTVFAIGFAPGFPYLGYLPEPLCGVPRLPSPRMRVAPGSVAVTGRQTGIYPLPRPGGWNLIGKTPLVLVDVEDGYFPLQTGDRVRFERIDEAEYRRLEGSRLSRKNEPAEN